MQTIKVSVPAKTRKQALKWLKDAGYYVVASLKKDDNGEFICKVVV